MTVKDPWIRSGTVVAVVDGDSCRLHVDLGYRVWHDTRIRLLGINTPERGEVGWGEARALLGQLLPPGLTVTVRTTGPDKYGDRWDGAITLADGRDVGTEMLRSGLAKPYDGGPR